MPAPRKPTAQLKLVGAFKANPSRGRARANEPTPVGDLGPAPDWMHEECRKAWAELAAMAHPGVLCSADHGFMLYASPIYAHVKAMAVLGVPVDPKVGIRWEACIARLGMSPADRSRVSAIKAPAKADPYAKFRSSP